MWVRYFVPEDGDDVKHPNVFSISGEPILAEIEKSFPLPGKYHFRYLRQMGDNEVWMDATDPRQRLGNGDAVLLKVTRVALNAETIPNTPIAAATTTAAKPTPRPAPVVKEPEGLLNFGDDVPAPAQPASVASPFDSDLLAFSSAPAPQVQTQPSADPFGMDSLQPNRITPPASTTSQRPMVDPFASTNMNTSYRPMGGVAAKPANYDPFSDISGMGGSGRSGMNSNARRNY